MWAGELLAGIDFGKRIRRNFGVRRCLAGRTSRMSLGLRACREVVVLVGLVIASIVPFAKAKALPPKDGTNRTTYGAVRAELSNLSPVSRIRSWNGDMYTRVVIDVGSEVKYRRSEEHTSE